MSANLILTYHCTCHILFALKTDQPPIVSAESLPVLVLWPQDHTYIGCPLSHVSCFGQSWTLLRQLTSKPGKTCGAEPASQ